MQHSCLGRDSVLHGQRVDQMTVLLEDALACYVTGAFEKLQMRAKLKILGLNSLQVD